MDKIFKKLNVKDVKLGLLVKVANEPMWKNTIVGKFIGEIGEICELVHMPGKTVRVWYPKLNTYWSWHIDYLTLYSNQE